MCAGTKCPQCPITFFVGVISSCRHIHGRVNQPVIQVLPISIGKIVLPHSWLRFHTRNGKAKQQNL